jgi:hypothetical protein
MITQKGWNQNLMMSSYKKEATYAAAVTVNATNFTSITGHADYDPDWADVVENDKDTVSGAEFGTDLDIISQGLKFTISQPRAKPNFLIGAMAGALGDITSSQDTGYTAYQQKIVPVTVGATLPSFNVIGKKAGLQYLHKGCKVNSVNIVCEEGKPVSSEIEIIGSGDRTTNADAFVAEPTESWMLMKNGYIWVETGASISIDAADTQGSENISSGTPRDLKVQVQRLSWSFNNNLEGQPGFGNENGGVFQDMDYGMRTQELSLTLLYDDETDITNYLATTAFALELEVKGALIAVGGTMYYGFTLQIPRFKLMKAPLPKGGVGDRVTQEFECDIQDDGVNDAVIFYGYNAQEDYLIA